MAKKTKAAAAASIPTGETLHKLLVDQEKVAGYTQNTLSVLKKAIKYASITSQKITYEEDLKAVEKDGLTPERHVTLQGLFTVLTSVWAGMSCPVFSLRSRDTFLKALFKETPLDYAQLYSSNARKLADGVWQYYHYYDSFNEKKKTANKGFKQSALEDRSSGLQTIYTDNPLKILKGIRRNLQHLQDEKVLSLQSEHVRLIEEMYFQLPGTAKAVPESTVNAEAQQELAMRRLCILAVTALLVENIFPKEDTPVWQWLQLKNVPTAHPTAVHNSIFGGDEVDLRLLPPISVIHPADSRKKSDYETDDGKSPLEQILDANTDAHLLLLYGAGNTSISGAGKTTMLRHLHKVLNHKRTETVMVPLCRAYAPDVLHREAPRAGHLYLEKALPNGNLPENGVLILDGLDELCSQDSIKALCHDLEEMTHYPNLRMRIILSSKSAPNTLPGWAMGLSGISRIFDSALKLQVCALPYKKAQEYLSDKDVRSDELAQQLNPDALLTPFYLRLLSATGALLETPLPIEQHLKARWFLDQAQSAKTPLPSEAEAFYRCLGAHVLRVFETGEGSDAANEQAAFHLFFTLPALAFHAVIHETTDPEFYFRTLPAMDETFARSVMDGVFDFFAPTLCQFHPYKNGSGLDNLFAAPPNADNFFHGPAAALFTLHRDFSRPRSQWPMEFTSNALKNNLAALHVANMLVALSHRQENALEIAAPFDQAVFLYLPRYLIHSADKYLSLLLDNGADVTDFLKNLDPDQLTVRGRGRMVLCSLLYHLTRFIHPGDILNPDDKNKHLSFHRWLEATNKATEEVGDDSLGLEFRLFYLSEESRRTREINLPAAHSHAHQAVVLHKDFPQYIDKDEYNSLGQVYHQQVALLLNSSDDANEPIPDHWLLGSASLASALAQYSALLQESQPADPATHAVNTETSKRLVEELQQQAAQAAAALSEDLSFAKAYCEELSSALRSTEETQTANADEVPEKTIAAEMLQTAWKKVQLVQEIPSAPPRLQLLVQSSFIAKAYTIYAVLNGSSGAACNNLACLFEENVEVWMLDESLPFWQANPELRKLFGDAGQYAYEDHESKAYRFYDKCLNIRRGTQHYAACALLDLLLNDRLHLENGLPVPGGVHPLNDETITKITFLFDHISGADNFGRQAIYQLQYWNRLLKEKHCEHLQDTADALFHQEWKKATDKVSERKNSVKKVRDSRGNSPVFNIYDLCLLAQCPNETLLVPKPEAADIRDCYLHYFSNPTYRIGRNPQTILRREWPRIRQYLSQIPTGKFPEWDELCKALEEDTDSKN